MSKSEVSRIWAELDRHVTAFRERPLDEHRYPYVWLNAKVEKLQSSTRRRTSAGQIGSSLIVLSGLLV